MLCKGFVRPGVSNEVIPHSSYSRKPHLSCICSDFCARLSNSRTEMGNLQILLGFNSHHCWPFAMLAEADGNCSPQHLRDLKFPTSSIGTGGNHSELISNNLWRARGYPSLLYKLFFSPSLLPSPHGHFSYLSFSFFLKGNMPIHRFLLCCPNLKYICCVQMRPSRRDKCTNGMVLYSRQK